MGRHEGRTEGGGRPGRPEPPPRRPRHLAIKPPQAAGRGQWSAERLVVWFGSESDQFDPSETDRQTDMKTGVLCVVSTRNVQLDGDIQYGSVVACV